MTACRREAATPLLPPRPLLLLPPHPWLLLLLLLTLWLLPFMLLLLLLLTWSPATTPLLPAMPPLPISALPSRWSRRFIPLQL